MLQWKIWIWVLVGKSEGFKKNYSSIKRSVAIIKTKLDYIKKPRNFCEVFYVLQKALLNFQTLINIIDTISKRQL